MDDRWWINGGEIIYDDAYDYYYDNGYIGNIDIYTYKVQTNYICLN